MRIPRVTVTDERQIEVWTGSLAVFLRENRAGIDRGCLTAALREGGRYTEMGLAFTVALI